MTSRRGFLLGLGAALAAPAVVRAESLMKIAALRQQLNEASLLEFIASERILVVEPAFIDFSAVWAWKLVPSGDHLVKIPVYRREVYAHDPS